MRLSEAAAAAVQLRSAIAAKLNLRIIAESLVKRCWKPRQPGGEDSEAGCAHRSVPGGLEPEQARESPAERQWEQQAGGSKSSSQGSPPCSGPGPTRLRPSLQSPLRQELD